MTKFDLYFLKFLIHSTNNDTYQGMQTLRKLFCICQRQGGEKGFKTFDWDFNQIVEFKSSSCHAIFKLECSKYKGRYYHRNNVVRIEYIYDSNLSLKCNGKSNFMKNIYCSTDKRQSHQLLWTRTWKADIEFP